MQDEQTADDEMLKSIMPSHFSKLKLNAIRGLVYLQQSVRSRTISSLTHSICDPALEFQSASMNVPSDS